MAANEYPLTGLEKTGIEAICEGRHDPKLDGPAYDVAADMDEDGLVTFRPATPWEQVERIYAEYLWSQIDGAVGDVAAETPQEAAARRRDEWIRRFGPIPRREP